MKIGVTGVSGHLGKRLMRHDGYMSHEFIPLYRGVDIPHDIDLLIHLAAPREPLGTDMNDFMKYNVKLLRAKERVGFRVVGAGSLWQLGRESSVRLPYTQIKSWQQENLNDVTLVLYSVYSEEKRLGRGFIPELVESVKDNVMIPRASSEVRDWIHVDDVCRAFLKSIEISSGIYQVCTGRSISPSDLVERFFGKRPLELHQEVPHTLTYEYPFMKGWAAEVDLNTWITEETKKDA